MRWCYRREGEVLICALALTADYSAYELRVTPARLAPGLTSELFDDAIAAFQRQATVERALMGDGWVLERVD